jgi:hypothetical protein
MTHLVVVITPHGYGHTAQTAPVVNALRRLRPDLRLTLMTTAPRALLDARFDAPFEVVAHASDFGMLMHSAVEVRVAESAQAYRTLHHDWEARVAHEAGRLRTLAPDLVLANIPYLTLAAAAQAGIPAAALGSLNWADIYRHYCGEFPEAGAIHAQMLAAYRSVRLYLRTEPAMPMLDISGTRALGAVARVGVKRRAEITRKLGLAGDERLVIVAPGGIPTRWPLESWPAFPGVRFIVQSDWQVARADCHSLETLAMPFTDLLASSDALIGKPGYGSVAECACNGTPMLYLERGDWPEERYLLDWLHRHTRAARLTRAQIERGDLADALRAVWDMPAPEIPTPDGIQQGAHALAALMNELGD